MYADRPVKRSFSSFFALLLSLLVFATQLEAAMHALTHLAPGDSRDHSLVAPNNDVCVECALLAGSANAIANTAHGEAVTIAAEERPQFAPVPIAPAFSSYYFSRAPPALL